MNEISTEICSPGFGGNEILQLAFVEQPDVFYPVFLQDEGLRFTQSFSPDSNGGFWTQKFDFKINGINEAIVFWVRKYNRRGWIANITNSNGKTARVGTVENPLRLSIDTDSETEYGKPDEIRLQFRTESIDIADFLTDYNPISDMNMIEFTNQTSITVNHGQNKYYLIQVMDTDGNIVIADINQTLDSFTVSLQEASSGKVIFK